MNRLTDNEFIRFPVIVHQCLADYFLFGNACFETMFGQRHQQYP